MPHTESTVRARDPALLHGPGVAVSRAAQRDDARIDLREAFVVEAVDGASCRA